MFRLQIRGRAARTRCLVLAALALAPLAHPATAEMISGTYTGNGGASQVVTGLGFTPAVVIIKVEDTKTAVVRTASMPGDSSKALTGGVALVSGQITSLDADGFTVGSDDTVNKNGISYYWAAFEERAGVMDEGTYTGDGSADRVISGVGFQSDLTVVMSAANREAMLRTGASLNSFNFSNGPGQANVITNPAPADGFRVGSDIRANENGVVFYYVCWNEVAGLQTFGSYVGDGNDNRDLSVTGFQPEYVVVRDVSTGEDTMQRTASWGAPDASLPFNAQNSKADRIQGLLADGFQVGKHNSVNRGGDFYAYMAWAPGPTYQISGRVFEDADFAGTASGWDGGIADAGLANVDVELYDADGGDAFVESATTGAGGSFVFVVVSNGNYKVRVRSATIGDADTPPAGGLNATVPGTWPYPLPEMTWGNGSAAYGGQSPTVDDSATGDDAGPGDTWVPVTVNDADVTGVDFGFAFNLVVTPSDSGQGSLRRFLENANAIGSAGGTTANQAQFRVPGALLDGNGMVFVEPATSLPALADAGGGTVLDGGTQTANGGDTNPSGPEVEISGATAGGDGLSVTSADNAVRRLVLHDFASAVRITGAARDTVSGCYLGTSFDGASALPNGYGVLLEAGATSAVVGGTAAGEANLIAYNTTNGVFVTGAATDGNRISGSSIFGNGALGIDLAPAGVGTGGGANDDHPAPVITGVTAVGTDQRVVATVTAGDTVELFRVNNAAAPVVGPDGSGSGEGYLYLGSCVDNGACAGPYLSSVTDGDGAAGTVQADVPRTTLGYLDWVTATATGATDGTSEFAVNARAAARAIVKRAFLMDGTPVTQGQTLPAGTLVRYLLYINNLGGAASDVSLRDVLDPAFQYVPGSVLSDNSLGGCAGIDCTAPEESAILAAALAGTAGTDGVDGDFVSFISDTLDAGDAARSNAPLDIAADRVWAMVFTVKID